MPQISFADLTHVGDVVDANYTPLSVGYIAAYAKEHLGDDIDVKLFKYPAELARYLDQTIPTMACFSYYMWNARLQLEFARRIKQRHPQVATVFGGPNYPIDFNEQQKFLQQHEEIDFYVDGEGESAFVGLFLALQAVHFDVAGLKSSLAKLPNVHYMAGDTFVRGELLPRIRDLDANLPSPFLSGLLDEFFDETLHPLVQTSRGCPYSCTFCHDGIEYMSKTSRFSQERIDAELEYISERVKVPGLVLADLNWGMFPKDTETARTLATLQKEKGWPVHIASATAKNQKDRVVEMALILDGTMQVGAAVQSTDTAVLSTIKRANIGFDALVKMAKGSAQSNTPTYSEVILGLPGDTKEKHFKTVFDMLDAGIQDIYSYQFILLPGTESANNDSRGKFEYQTRFRVLPRCFGRYRIYGEDVPVAEMHEVCIANDSMSIDDYLACRDFDLSMAIFGNGNIFEEVMGLAEALDLSRSVLIGKFHQTAMAKSGKLEEMYRDYRADEARNFWESSVELDEFLSQPDGFEAYLSGYYGANQIFKYRSIAVFELLEEITEVALSATREVLRDRNLLDTMLDQYLDELREIIVARKSQVTDTDRQVTLPVHFDFAALDKQNFSVDPREAFVAGGVGVSVFHSDHQQEYLSNYFRQYPRSLEGLTYFIHRHPARMLYRQIGVAKSDATASVAPNGTTFRVN